MAAAGCRDPNFRTEKFRTIVEGYINYHAKDSDAWIENLRRASKITNNIVNVFKNWLELLRVAAAEGSLNLRIDQGLSEDPNSLYRLSKLFKECLDLSSVECINNNAEKFPNCFHAESLKPVPKLTLICSWTSNNPFLYPN